MADELMIPVYAQLACKPESARFIRLIPDGLNKTAIEVANLAGINHDEFLISGKRGYIDSVLQWRLTVTADCPVMRLSPAAAIRATLPDESTESAAAARTAGGTASATTLAAGSGDPAPGQEAQAFSAENDDDLPALTQEAIETAKRIVEAAGLLVVSPRKTPQERVQRALDSLIFSTEDLRSAIVDGGVLDGAHKARMRHIADAMIMLARRFL